MPERHALDAPPLGLAFSSTGCPEALVMLAQPAEQALEVLD